MTEYIEREAALEEANGFPFICLSEQECVGMQRAQAIIAKRIEALPAADVRPVVRCKDCVYHYYAVDCAGMCKIGIGNALVDNDFCSRGIRKSGADMREVDDG